jgi:hypothetical protein
VSASANDLPSLIGALGDSDSAKRENAASQIFQRGCDIARAAVENWLADTVLARCFVFEASDFPVATVGVAVEPHNFSRIRRACGSPALANAPPDQDVQEFELAFSTGVRIDILTTRQPGGLGTMARHLQKFGEGIQQVELLAANVDTATEILRSRFGLTPVFPATRSGANGTRVNFFLVPGPQGKKVLIELVEAGTPA